MEFDVGYGLVNFDFEFFLVFVISALIFGGIGFAVGKSRGRGPLGFLLGTFFGPLGWIVVLLLAPEGRKCPECLGIVPGQARRCQHCGSNLPQETMLSTGNSRQHRRVTHRLSAHFKSADQLYVSRGYQTEGPFSQAQIETMIRSGVLSDDALLARTGDTEWRRIGDLL